MNTPIMPSTLVLALTLSLSPGFAGDSTTGTPSKFDPAPGWPMVSGPYGNFNPRQHGHKLVDSLGEARVLWKSDTGALGMGKMFRKGGGAGGQPPGTASGVIVAQGMVFGNGFAPRANGRGLPFEGRSLKDEARAATGKKLEQILSFWSVEADDLFVAYDQRTGRTVWQVNEINQGIHRGMAKRSGFHSTPVWHDGKLFGIGTTLRAYAYDAATGRKLWEADPGPAHAKEEFFKQRCLENRILPGSGGFASAAVAVSPAGSTDRAVVVMPRYDVEGGDSGLIGFDPATGAVLWEIIEGVQSRYAAPAVWTDGGRQYLLTASRGPGSADAKGILRMIDPGTGKVLWSDEIAPMWKPIITSGKYAFVLLPVTNMTPEEIKLDPFGRARYACYEISTQGAKKVWALPDNFRSSTQNHMDCGPMREVLVRDGLMIWHNNGGHMAVHRMETGEKIFERFYYEDKKEPKLHGSYGYFLEDCYFYVADAAHSGLAGGVFFSLKPPGFACLAPSADVPGADRATTGYEVFLENPYVDGIMYVRTQTEGRINAVDLRRNPPKEAPTPLPLPEWAAKLSEPVRLLASRYRDERDAAAAKLIALPVAQRPLPELLELAGHKDHLVRQAAAQVLAASTAGLGSHSEAVRTLAVQALANNDEDGLELFIPIALAVDTHALVNALQPAIESRLNDPKQSRLALKTLGLTGKAGSAMVDKVLPLLRDKDERVVFEAAQTLARIGGGNTKVVAALLGLLGPLATGDSPKLLTVASSMGALRYMAENGGIPADPERLLPLCSRPVKQLSQKGRFGPGIWGGQGGYWQTRMLVASHQGEVAVPSLREEIDAILPAFRATDDSGFVDAVAAAARAPDIRERLEKIAAGDFGNETIAAGKILESIGGAAKKSVPAQKKETKTPPSLDDAIGL
jgi:outer membrane protein assembly factor BamB/HEAT repeat protein